MTATAVLWIQLAAAAAFLWFLLRPAASGRSGPVASLEWPWLRSRRAWILAAAVALAGSLRTISEGYISDDYWQLRIFHGEAPGDLFIKEYVASFWRPVVWLAWWVYANAFGENALPARLLSIALFAAAAACLPRALRRLGGSREGAVLGATLWAASHAAIDTVSWLTNQYSLFSFFFGILWIAFALPRRPGFGAALAGGGLAALSLLAKEDGAAFLVLAWIALRGWRRGRRLGAALALAPAVAAVAAVSWLRILRVPSAPYYQMAAGDPAATILQIARGAWAALSTESPFHYLFTFRGLTLGAWLAPALMLASAAVLAGVRVSAAAKRRLACAAAVFVAFLVPVALFLPFDVERYGARLSFALSVATAFGISEWTAVALPAVFARRALALAWISLAAVGAQWSHGAWLRAHSEFGRAREALSPLVSEAPPASSVLVLGQPDMVGGIPCCRNATAGALWFATRRDDLAIWTPSTIPASSLLETALGAIAAYVPGRGAIDAGRFEGASDISPGDTLDLAGEPFRGAIFATDATCTWSGGILRMGVGDECLGVLLLPPVRCPTGGMINIQAELAQGSEGSFVLCAAWREGGKLMHRLLSPASEMAMPPDADAVRFEIWAAAPANLSFRGVFVRVR